MARKTTSPEVRAFLDELPEDRRAEFERVRDLIRKNLPAGYEEVVGSAMLVYQVPLKRYPDTYNKQPLMYVALSMRKASMSLYLLPVYGSPELLERLTEGFRLAGKKLDMGKSCLHFRKADDLALDVIAEIVAKIPLDRWVEIAEAARQRKK